MTSFTVLAGLFRKGAKQEDVTCVLRLDEMFLSDNSRVFLNIINCARHLEVVA